MPAPRLIDLIHAIVGPDPGPAPTAQFVTLCRTIAVVQLRRREAVGKLDSRFFRMPVEDLALDCIADLLRREADGTFPQLQAYFESVSYASLEEAELLAHLRRLVYGKVNQALFRLYNELDPSLGKILRNMKLAFQSAHSLTVVERLGEQYLVPSACDTLEHLPPFTRPDLETLVRGFFHEDDRMPQLLAALTRSLREQTDRSRLVPVMMVAMTFRDIHAGDNEARGAEPGVDEQLFLEDAARVIDEACRRVRLANEPGYVGKKRVPAEIFSDYFRVIKAHLHRKFVGDDGEEFSFYEGLRAHHPELSVEEYRREHRSRLEYLSRQAEHEVLELAKDELGGQ